jgi:hypothetical protein
VPGYRIGVHLISGGFSRTPATPRIGIPSAATASRHLKGSARSVIRTLSKTVAEARAVPAGTVGPGYFAPMRADEFVASRIVEAVVHGIDLTQALGQENIAPADRLTNTGWPRHRAVRLTASPD